MEGERLMIQINNFTIPVQEQEKLRVLDIDKPHAKAEIALLGRNGPLVASVEVMEVQAPWKAPQPGTGISFSQFRTVSHMSVY